jgi:hypothetical protein
MPLYTRARDLFIQMLMDGADFIAALEARERYMRENLWCKRCDEVKERDAFYHIFGTLAQFPCKACQAVGRRWKSHC